MITEIETYLTTLKSGGLSEHTIRAYRKDLQKFSDHFKISKISEIEELSLEQFYSFYNSLPLKASSKNGLIRNLSAFFNWAVPKIIKTSAFFDVTFGGQKHYVKEIIEKKMILTQEETEALIKAGATIQERFMLALMSFTAIRRGEVVKIKLSDIQGCKVIIHGKGDKIRSVFLDEVLCTMLNIVMANRETDSQYLFYGERGETTADGAMSTQTVYNRVKSAGERAGIVSEKLEKLSPHRLRGTAITRLIILFGLDVAQRVAGHTNNIITKRYDESGDALVEAALMGQRQAMEDRLNK